MHYNLTPGRIGAVMDEYLIVCATPAVPDNILIGINIKTEILHTSDRVISNRPCLCSRCVIQIYPFAIDRIIPSIPHHIPVSVDPGGMLVCWWFGNGAS